MDTGCLRIQERTAPVAAASAAAKASRAFFGAGQIELAAAAHDDFAVVDEQLQHALQRQHAR
ncbi:MAG TPA: hypothetical protein VK416_01990, partial [Thermoanaerobaculia bacterium]|nr:hypothetical protein [Thermoanaerobaculia bacterium]